MKMKFICRLLTSESVEKTTGVSLTHQWRSPQQSRAPGPAARAQSSAYTSRIRRRRAQGASCGRSLPSGRSLPKSAHRSALGKQLVAASPSRPAAAHPRPDRRSSPCSSLRAPVAPRYCGYAMQGRPPWSERAPSALNTSANPRRAGSPGAFCKFGSHNPLSIFVRCAEPPPPRAVSRAPNILAASSVLTSDLDCKRAGLRGTRGCLDGLDVCPAGTSVASPTISYPLHSHSSPLVPQHM